MKTVRFPVASLVLCFVSLSWDASLAISRPSSIVLENNEFRNILVAINDNVPNNPTLIDTIKSTFTKASAFLYSATNHRAVFRDVTILVPAGWTNIDTYDKATSEVFNNADVIFSSPISPAPPSRAFQPAPRSNDVKPRTARSSGDQSEAAVRGDVDTPPFHHQPAMTKVYAGCGHPGVRVTLTTDILTDRRLQASLGPPEKVLVHEWSHFRWGVFDEYGLDGEPQFYFSPSTGQLEGVRCTEMIKGILQRVDPSTGHRDYCRELDPNTGLYPEGCQFLPYPAGPYVNGIEASIMDHVNIRPISKFCDDDKTNNATRHNYDAPSRHNRLCGHRSTWDIISNSLDFSNGNNAPREGLDTAPVFKVVQANADPLMVLAIDASESMADDEKLTRASQAVATFVQEGVAPSAKVGLTTFSDELHVHRAPQSLNTSQDRRNFVDEIPDKQGGATDITLGLITAAQLLRNQKSTPPNQQTTLSSLLNNSSLTPSRYRRESHVTHPAPMARGGHVVMVTDGQETSGEAIRKAFPELHEAGVMVSFVVLGGPPHPELERLAQETGGRVYCDSNLHSSTATTDAFFDILDSYSISSSPSPIQVLSRAEALSTGHSLQGVVYLDEDLGEKTIFLVYYDITMPNVSVTSPSGRVYSRIYPEYSLHQRLKMIKILIPRTAESGRWSFRITNAGSYQRVSLLVLSSPANASVIPVRLSGTLMSKKQTSPSTIHIFAEATRGDKPVTGLMLTALVHKPDGSSETVVLMDNGAGSDIVENDGVYSRYFSTRTPGLYTFHLTAVGHYHQGVLDRGPIDPRNVLVQRSVSAGYIVVRTQPTTRRANSTTGSRNGDIEAPVRISDLRVVKTSSQNRTVVLSWRASGDDADRDTASHYEVYIAPTAMDLMRGTSLVTSVTQNDVIHGSLVTPKPFGAREFYMLRIPSTVASNGSFVFTVVAVDEAGNRGDHSNYVTVGLGKVPDVTDHRYWKDSQFQAATPQLAAPHDERLLIAGVLGTVSTLLFLVIVVSVVVSLCTRKKKDDGFILPVHHNPEKSSGNAKKNEFALS